MLCTLIRPARTDSCLKRTLFSFPSSQPKTFHERKILPYTREQLYAVVSDVSSYPKFIPHCTGSRILQKTTRQDVNSVTITEMEAELTVGFLNFKESYVSRVTCTPHESVQAVATSSTPLFKTLSTIWQFHPASPRSPHPRADGTPVPEHSAATSPTLVTLDLSYAFANPLHATVSDKFFGKVSRLMVNAFEERCRAVYGSGRE